MPNEFRGLGGKYYDSTNPDDVKALQTELNNRGYNVSVDGAYGPETDAAYRDANNKEYGGPGDPSYGRAQVDNPNIAPGLPGSAFGEVNPYGDPNFDITTRPDLQQWQQDNLGNPTTPDEEAAAVEQMVAARALAERTHELTVAAQEASAQHTLDAQKLLNERKAARNSGILGRIKDIGSRFIDALGKPFEETIAQPYEAGNRARLLGAGTLSQAQATVAGLPGLGGLAPKSSLARKAIEQTNTPQERAALTEQHQLTSFGEQLSGKSQDLLSPELRGRASSGPLPGTKLPSALRGVASGASDLALGFFGDPLTSVLPGAKSITVSSAEGVLKAAALKSAREKGGLARAGEVVLGRESKRLAQTEYGIAAQAAGRAAVADGRLGRAVIDNVVQLVKSGTRDSVELTKRVDGLSNVAAREILDVAKSGTEAEVREAVRRALIDQSFDPKLGRIRQALGSATGGLGVKGGLIEAAHVREGLRALSRGTGEGFATGVSRSAPQALERAITSATQRGRTFVGDIAEAVRPEIAWMSEPQRISRIKGLAEGGDNAAFRDAVASELARVAKSQDPAEVEHVLTRLEGVEHILSGKAGGAAQRQAATELSLGFRQTLDTASGREVAKVARKNVGLGAPSKEAVAAYEGALKTGGADAVKGLRSRITASDLPTDIRQGLLDDLGKAIKAKKGLGRVASDFDILRSPTIRPEVDRLLENAADRTAQAVQPEVRVGLGRRIAGAAAKLPLSLEPIAPGTTSFARGATTSQQLIKRVEAVDRWGASVGLDDFTRSALRQSAESARTEAELFTAVGEGVRRMAERNGVDPDEFEALYAAQFKKWKADHPTRATKIGPDGKIETDIFTKAQLVEEVPLPDPGDMKKSLDKMKAGQGDVGAKLTSFTQDATDGKVKQILKAGHGFWKFNIVTNAYLPVVGAVGGFIGNPTDKQSWDERIKRAGIGFGIGLLGPARYVIRVPLMEERLRFYMERGFTPTEWVPGVAKWAATRGLDRPFVSESVVHAANVLDRLVGGRLLSTATDDFVSVAKNEPNFVDGWWRIVNHQVSPESDELARILLNEKAGQLTIEEATKQAKDFLKTEEGKLHANRLAAGLGGSSSPKVIIDKYRQFMDTYITNSDLAAARLQVGEKKLAGEVDAEVGRDTLKQAVKEGISPEYVHAQQSWVVPKTIQQARETFNKSLATFVFEGPTSQVNRLPLARSIYRDEYLNLINGGMEHGRAAEIADEIATKRTNKIMFQVDDESRMAKKVDFVFPFQQPREEFFRVWAPLVKSNPGRAMKTTRLAALAFNNGQEAGVFRKDPVSGQWVSSVPHSNWLGEHLFGGLPGQEANLKDLLLPAQGAFTAGMGVIPNPGGPWFTTAAKLWFTSHPDQYENMPKELKGLLFPYGIKGNLLRPEAARLWMGMTSSVPPWEFASKVDQQNELDKWRKELYRHLKVEHWNKTGDAAWEPSEKELNDSLRSFMQMWSVIGNTYPASPHPAFPEAAHVDAIYKAHTDPQGNVDYDAINRDFPLAVLYRTANSKYVGPDDFQHWADSENISKRNDQFQLGLRRQLTVDEFKKEIADAQRRTEGYRLFGNILNQPGSSWEREAAMQDWREKYPDLAASNRQNYFRNVELNKILNNVPIQDRPAALDRWRKEYDVSAKEYNKLKNEYSKPGSINESAWKAARYPEDVAVDVQRHIRQGLTEDAYVATLNPAEQIGYWKTKQSQLNDYSKNGDPQAVLDAYSKFGQNISQVYKAHPELNVKAPGTPFDPTDFNRRITQPFENAISANYAEAARLKDAMDVAAKNKEWTAVYQMKDKRDALFTQITDLRNQEYQRFPQLDQNTDIQALMVFAGDKDAVRKFNASPLASTLPWLHSNEEAHYLNMPQNVQSAYIKDMQGQLNQANGTTGKVFWEWLSTFQQQLLTKNLPADMIRNWSSQSPSSAASGSGSGDAKGFQWVQVNGKWVLYYKGTPYRGGGSGFGGKFYGSNNTIGNGAGDLAYALEKFAQYDQRGGRAAPAGYDEYLALPANPGVRSQYLKSHPEVAQYIKDGPLANMPEMERYIVTNIMIKYGKWDGDMRTNQEITDLSFAHEQLKQWTKRPEGATAPENYDIWLNMPSGADKQAYLKAHPEVTDWIRLGPMSNMPEEYQTVVRDIMLRYGEWTQKQDPLGDLINQYYRTPTYARQAFLKQHPELTDYWAASRSPEDQAKFNLSDQYFSIQSSTAKKAFLLAHPELQDFFLTSRTKRYEKFVNQVAQFMGSNPEMFKGYLDRQNDILAELLKRYAEPNLLREVTNGVTSQSTHGVKARAA